MKTKLTLLVGICAVASLLMGCKAKPGKTTGFLGNDPRLKQDPQLKIFHKTWYKQDADWDKYRKIHVPPVNTRYLQEMGWWDKCSLKGEQKEQDIKDLATYMWRKVVEAQKQNTHRNRLPVVNRPDRDTIIMELALTEVVPTKAWLNWISYAGTMMSLDQATVAFEGRLRDGATREIICKFADREMGKANLIGNIKDFGWSGHAKAIIDEWAKQFVDVVNMDDDDVLKDSLPFELKVW